MSSLIDIQRRIISYQSEYNFSGKLNFLVSIVIEYTYSALMYTPLSKKCRKLKLPS
jgi:hypothetical protein